MTAYNGFLASYYGGYREAGGDVVEQRPICHRG